MFEVNDVTETAIEIMDASGHIQYQMLYEKILSPNEILQIMVALFDRFDVDVVNMRKKYRNLKLSQIGI
jgi:hypothetical protein